MPQVLSLRPEPDNVRLARDFCRHELACLVGGDEDTLADAAMITSELVTNAIRAGATTIRLLVEPGGRPGCHRIVVIDDADGVVAAVDPAPLATSGRGLHIVAALAVAWGVQPGPGGKRVWAELRAPDVTRPELGEFTDAAAS